MFGAIKRVRGTGTRAFQHLLFGELSNKYDTGTPTKEGSLESMTHANTNEQILIRHFDSSRYHKKDNNIMNPNNGSALATGFMPDEDSSQAKDMGSELVTDSPPSLLKLLSLARPEGVMLACAFLLMLAEEAGSLIIPLIIAKAYNALINPALTHSEIMSRINWIMIRALIIHLAGSVAAFIRTFIMQVIGERVVARVRQQLYAAILKQEIAFFDEYKTGDLVSRLGSDTTLLQQATSNAAPEVVVGLVKVVVAIILMFWIAADLAALVMGFAVVILLLCWPFGTAIGQLTKTYQEVLGLAQTFSTEALGTMRTVQSFSAQDKELHRYQDKIGQPDQAPLLFRLWYPENVKQHVTTYSVGYFRSLMNTAFFVTIFGCGFGFLYCTLWYGFKLVNDKTISLGDLTAFESYIFQIGAALSQASSFAVQLLEARGASARIFQILERIPNIPQRKPPDETKAATPGATISPNTDPCVHVVEPNNALTEQSSPNDDENPAPLSPPFFESTLVPSSVTGEVEFHNVSFSYPSRSDVSVLQNFSLKIRSGESTALVGSSGSGKSTVVALIQRFYDLTSGSITLDGNDIRRLDLNWLRRQIGYVQQEPQLFGLTIRQNVRYGILENEQSITDEQVHEACRKANAHDFIQEWPNGYDTLVGERGVKLSGGQKQRIAIARALLINPRILLLDEATSALDAESEHLVQEAIDQAVQGRTVLIVAHRLSTIQGAHQIVVMDNHQIVDVGTHAELLKRCTKYRELIKRQNNVQTADSSQ